MIFWIVNPFDNLPGEGRRPLRYWTLCRSLAAAGHRAVWWSSDFHHGEKRRRELPATYEADGFQVRLVPTPAYRRNIGLKRWRSHAAFARNWENLGRDAVGAEEIPKPDLIVTSLPPLGTADAAFRLRKDWGCKAVVDVMDAWPETFYRIIPGPARLREMLGPFLFRSALCQARRAFQQADAVTAVGQTYLDLARRHGCTRPQQLCYHGIALQPALQRQPRKPGDGLRLVYIGFMGDSYDLQTVLAGTAALIRSGTAVSLDMAGCGPKEQTVTAWIGAQPAKVQENIRLHGYLQAGDLHDLLLRSDLALIPMKPESWVAVPYKAGDYAEAGLAMLNCLSGETQELLAAHEAGSFYRVGDTAGFMEAVAAYVRDPGRVAREGKNARRLAEECFEQGRIYPELVRFLERVALTERTEYTEKCR